MRPRPALSLLAAGIPLALGSCGLVKLPFRVAGAVVEGTAEAGKMMGSAASKPFAKTPEERAEAAKEKAAKDEQDLKEKQAKQQAETDQHADAIRKADADNPAGIPDAPNNEPLPDDSLPLPYEDPNALPPAPEGY